MFVIDKNGELCVLEVNFHLFFENSPALKLETPRPFNGNNGKEEKGK